MITISRSLAPALLLLTLWLSPATMSARDLSPSPQPEPTADQQPPLSTGETARVNYLIIVVSLFLFWQIYRLYGRRPDAGTPPVRPEGSLPGTEPPAAVGWLLGGRTVGLHEITATLLDLARRGFLTISEGEPVAVRLKGELPSFTVEPTGKQDEGALMTWETQLLDLIGRQPQHDSVPLRSLLSSLHTSGAGWFERWQQQLETYGYDRGWVDQKSFTGAYLNAGVQLTLFIGGLVWALNSGPSSPTSLFAMLLVTLLAAGLSAIIPHRTLSGEQVYLKWDQYRRTLLRSGSGSGELSPHLAYAMVLRLDPDSLVPAESPPGPVSWFTPLPTSPFTPRERYRVLLTIPDEER